MPATLASTGGDVSGRRDDLVLVVGCGFIGSNVSAELTSRGRPFALLTRSRPEAEVLTRIRPERVTVADAADRRALERALEGVGRVVYCAGGPLPAEAERDPAAAERRTLAPVRALLAALRGRPGVSLVHISSGGTIYGEPDSVPVPEDAPTRPRGAYGRLHVAAEEEIARARRENGLLARVLRCATVYGEHQHPDRGQGAVVTFLHRVEQGRPIELYGGGSSVRDYIYVGDVARTVAELLDRGEGPDVLNVGSGTGTSLAELLNLVEAEVGRQANVSSRADRSFDVERLVLDTGRLRELIDFEPVPLEAGVARTHSWLASAIGQVA